MIHPLEAATMKRGAITISDLPRQVKWRGRPINLSPTQAEILATVACRGRASFAAIESAMMAIGASPRTRAVHVHRIRAKFAAIGAADPFERLGNSGYRLAIEADEQGSVATIVGLRS